jgi:Fe-S-cluster containining protein
MFGPVVATCLSFHAPYRCRQSGACCRAGWTIPFDAEERQGVLALRLDARLLKGEAGRSAVAARHPDGRCTFFEEDTHHCAIHDAGGHAALPVSCRMFPRVVLEDGRGTFISLSHFCPTAAALLFEDHGEDHGHSLPAVAIVDAPAALTDVGPLDGLDAREVWPPLLRPGVMMDLGSYGMWERLGVELLTRDGVAPSTSLDALGSATARVASWSVGGAEALEDAVRDAFGLLTPPSAGTLRIQERAVKRWLAARLFANWIAYQGDGLDAIVRYLRHCLTTFTTELAHDGSALEAIRRSDLLILHRA